MSQSRFEPVTSEIHIRLSAVSGNIGERDVVGSVLQIPVSNYYGVLGFDSRRRLGIFLFTTVSRTALGPTQLPIKWVSGALSLGVKWSGLEADHSPPSSAPVKECVELYLQSPNTPSWRGAEISTGTLPFTFTFTEKHCNVFIFSKQVPCFGRGVILMSLLSSSHLCHTRVCPKVSGLAAWSENCKWYSYLPLVAVVSLFRESV
jgi:hypothetical protein